MPAGFPNENAYDDLLRAEGERVGVPWLFLKAIVAQESGFNPQAYRAEPARRDASYGLMQVLFATAKDLGYTGLPAGLSDPALNIYYGAEWAGRQWRRYGGNPGDAAAAYNAGTAYKTPAGLYVTKGGNPSVQNYVTKVLGYYALYQRDAGQSPGDATSAPAPPEGTEGDPPVPEATGGLLSEAEGAVSRLWQSASDLFSASPNGYSGGSGWGWAPLALLGILGAWVLYEVVT